MINKRICFVAIGLALATFTGVPKEAGTKNSDDKMRVGTYDSRTIAVAFVGSEAFSKWMANLKAESDKAKAEGNQKKVADLEAQAAEQQKLLHKQAFSTAPVDNILEHIKDKIPTIAKAVGVGSIVSKWDKDALAKYKSAEIVDVTMPLVEALHPNDRQFKIAKEIQRNSPVSIKEAEKIPADK